MLRNVCDVKHSTWNHFKESLFHPCLAYRGYDRTRSSTIVVIIVRLYMVWANLREHAYFLFLSENLDDRPTKDIRPDKRVIWRQWDRADSDASEQVVIVLRVTHPRTLRRSTPASESLARPRIFSFVYFRSSVDNVAVETNESVNHREYFYESPGERSCF